MEQTAQTEQTEYEETMALISQSVLSMTNADVLGLPDHVRSALDMKHAMTKGIGSLDQLRERMHECIHWNTLRGVPLSGAHLNRLFGNAARRLGTIPSEVLFGLTARKLIRTISPSASKVYVVATKLWEERLESMAAQNAAFDEAELAKQWIERAK